LVEVADDIDANAQSKTCRVRTRQLIKGETRPVDSTHEIDAPAGLAVGTLLLAVRTTSAGDVDWNVRPVDETSYAYYYRTPTLRLGTSERLRYFARYLEHRDPQIAADAFAEFARADYDQVAAVAAALDMAQVRRWLADPDVLPRRKGFYGLTLGLAERQADRAANAKLLKERILADEGDFRTGFDGLLAGYLLLEGEAALDLIDERLLKASEADPRPGDTRHAMTALRFYQEYGDDIPTERLAQSLRLLLARSDFAAAAIVDLARWQDWQSMDGVVACLDATDADEPATTRAVVGYLIACPTPAAAGELERLRKEHPDRTAAAERFLELFGGGLPKRRAE
jgi:hypothetical protein